MKTHFVKDRTGQIVSITTPALYVKTANQDLLSCKKCNKIGIRVILDEDPDISGLYMLDKDRQQHIQDSIPFISEDSDLYLIKIDLEMDWRKYRETTGLPMWHRRLMHCSFQNIKDTIPFTKGMEKLKNCRIDPQEKCPACAIGKSTLQDNPGPISRATQPLAKANFDVIVSSIVSIEGYNYVALIVDDCTGYRWLYGMKTRDQVVDVAKRWMAEIGDLREKYPLRVVMRDNAGENKSNALREYFTSMGVENYFSTAYEPWQDGLAEAAIKSTITTATCGMAESGMVGKFWFKAATNGKNCRNVTYKRRINSTPYRELYGKEMDLSRFRPFGCLAFMHLNKDRREKGKTAPRAVQVINLGFATDTNTSAYVVYNPATDKLLTTNQLVFDESFFPYRKESLIKQLDEVDNEIDILFKESSPITWLTYDPKESLMKYTKVHVGSGSDIILRSPVDENAYLKIDRSEYFKNLLATTSMHEKARMISASPCETPATKVKGLPNSINPDKPPKSYKDAMSREDSAEWAEAYNKEYMGLKQRNVFEVVRIEKGMKLMGMTTRNEYKVVNGEFSKRKSRLCAMGNQQLEGVQYNARDLYAPIMKPAEWILLAAIAAANKTYMIKYDTTQAFLYGDVVEDLYTRAPDWWPELIPEGHCLKLKKNIYGTRQAARAWHLKLSTWMEEHQYLPVNNEKTIFMKWDGDDFILHGIFVDDFASIPTSEKLKLEFEELYAADFDFTGGKVMDSFLGLEVEQSEDGIKLHLDTYVTELLEEYREYHRKFLKPKKVPMQPGLVLQVDKEDCPEAPDPVKQKFYRMMVAKIQFLAHWVRFDIAYPAAQLARFCATAGQSHWAALTHLMGYLSYRPSLKLKYNREYVKGLDGFADSDWGNSASRKSTSGLLARYNRSLLMWRSKMQKSIALSTAEAEYYSVSEMAIEMIYLRNLLANMGLPQEDYTEVFEDNTTYLKFSVICDNFSVNVVKFQ